MTSPESRMQEEFEKWFNGWADIDGDRNQLLECWQAAWSARTMPVEASTDIALNVRHKDCHKAADAFWTYWKANGETHKHGYYESTWGAINAALRLVGVVPHIYRAESLISAEVKTNG